jgi:DNA replication and repair protein RecF
MLKSIFLQNFRNYKSSEFNFENVTLILGPNTSGKTNLLEAIFLISTGKSFRADKDNQMIKFNEEIARIKAKVNDLNLEIVLANGQVNENSQFKKFLVNGVAKRRVDFAGNLLSVLFSPQDLEIITDSPSLRRDFLDKVLEQVDRQYRVANISYTKALRQRNALLEKARESGIRNKKQFEYWDNLIIENGEVLTKKRNEFIEFVNASQKDIFEFIMFYDKSEISKERLLRYESQEQAAGLTLVGPHRDDFSISILNSSKTVCNIKYFGSRGQQRLAILQLKILELLFIEKITNTRPLLILDDIFSELDQEHINLIFYEIGKQQTVITTTHKEFIPKKLLKSMKLINLADYSKA